jgi:hypothetical protein
MGREPPVHGAAKTRIRTAFLQLRDILGQSVSELDARGTEWPIAPSAS